MTPCMGRHTQQRVNAICTQWNVYRIIMWLVTATEVVHKMVTSAAVIYAGLAF
jgi:hypothetical protein